MAADMIGLVDSPPRRTAATGTPRLTPSGYVYPDLLASRWLKKIRFCAAN